MFGYSLSTCDKADKPNPCVASVPDLHVNEVIELVSCSAAAMLG